jgi:excisionase family DNA binding protein
MTLQQAADELGVHYMTAYRYVRTGRLPAVRVGGSWQVERDDLDDLRSPKPTRGPSLRRTIDLSSRIEARLVAGDERGAWDVVEAALISGWDPADVLLGGVASAMTAVGDRWETGELTVADEHRASATASRLISRLGARFTPRGRKRATVVLCTPAGERHGAPVAIAADLLRWRGIEVIELGADTPPASVAEFCRATPDLLAVGIACTIRAPSSARRTVTSVRREAPGVTIVMGGSGVAGAEEVESLGADVYSGRYGDELLAAVERLIAQAATTAGTRATGTRATGTRATGATGATGAADGGTTTAEGGDSTGRS